MKRTCLLLLLVVLAAACLVSTAPAAPAPPVSLPPAPPALLALEQKMAQIRFNTARVSGRFVLGKLGFTAGGAELGSGPAASDSLVTVSAGSIRLAPYASLSTSHVEFPGANLPGTLARSRQMRTIGASTYTYTPAVASFDGGRPWVRSGHRPPPPRGSKVALVAALLESLAPTLATAEDRSAAPFAKLSSYLGGAVSVREGGAVTVDGQQTAEFTATLSVVKLLAGKIPRQQLAKIERESLAKPSEASVELEVFIAPNGLPVRTIGTTGNHTEGLGIQEDILALEIPFAVHVPPARETIAQARLLQLERKRARKQLTKARARCLRSRHGRACAVRVPAAGHSGVSGRSVAPRSLR